MAGDYMFTPSLARKFEISLDATDDEWSEFLAKIEDYFLNPPKESTRRNYWDMD